MRKTFLIGFWLLIIALLIIAANTLPILTNKTEPENFTYEHPQDNYSLAVTGLWQVYDENDTSLTLVNGEKDCTITFTLEVGGYDYLTPVSAAEKFIDYNKKQFSDFSVTEGPEEGNIGTYPSAAYLCSLSQDKEAYLGQQAVIHPNEGIRLYVSFIYPADCDQAAIEEGENIIKSISFTDTESLYAKFM